MDRRRLYGWALRAYPATYRRERGREMADALAEMSSGGTRVILAEVTDLVGHGLQQRLGLTVDRYVGRTLADAATPGLCMAAGYAAAAFLFGERLPLEQRQAWAHMGPFPTIGPLVYALWLLAAGAALSRPRLRRPLTVAAVLATLAAVPIGDAFFARPPLTVLVLLAGLGLPALLAPAPLRWERPRGSGASAALGLATVVFVVLLEMSPFTLPLFSTPLDVRSVPGVFFQPLYDSQGFEVAALLPYVAMTASAALVWTVARARGAMPAWTGACAVLLVPWFVVGSFGSATTALDPGPFQWPFGVDTVAAVVVLAGLGLQWPRRVPAGADRGDAADGTVSARTC